MTSPDPAAPLEPEVAVVLDDWVISAYESGVRNVAAQREIDRLTAEDRLLTVACDAAYTLFEHASREAVLLLEELEACKINCVTTSPRLWVDYTIYGRSRILTARVLRPDRGQLTIGQEVIVEGDTVNDARAVILGIVGADVHLQLLDEDDDV